MDFTSQKPAPTKVYSQMGSKKMNQLFGVYTQNASNKNSIDTDEDSNMLTPSFTQELSPSSRDQYRYMKNSNKAKKDMAYK